MYSNSSFKKYFFIVLGLWIAFIGVSVYLFYLKEERTAENWKILAVNSVSFMLNLITILNFRFKKKKKIWALIIYGLLFFASLPEFLDLNTRIAYLLLSAVLLLVVDILPISSSLKYFNIGMLITISCFLYFPIGIIVILFLIITILYYEKNINISQYLAGVLVTIVLITELTYLTDNLSYVSNWLGQLSIPEIHFEYQIPILIILLVILIYGWVNQYSDNNISEEVEIASKHTILVLYLLSWIIIYAFFMGSNFGLLIFISLPVSIIVSRSL
ncbi:MAG: DUF6427 family protein [Flavobacteriaceae bacterium]|jgi:hypothetical protein|nr:DUF6427 family protein [Flavobacteriaceae bacterium]